MSRGGGTAVTKLLWPPGSHVHSANSLQLFALNVTSKSPTPAMNSRSPKTEPSPSSEGRLYVNVTARNTPSGLFALRTFVYAYKIATRTLKYTLYNDKLEENLITCTKLP